MIFILLLMLVGLEQRLFHQVFLLFQNCRWRAWLILGDLGLFQEHSFSNQDKIWPTLRQLRFQSGRVPSHLLRPEGQGVPDPVRSKPR